MLKINSNGITLLEVFVAAFIFIISVSAVFATLNSTRKPAINNDAELQAALVLKGTLDSLRSKVDVRNQSLSTGLLNNELSIGTHWVNRIGPANIYNVTYVVSQGGAGSLQVTANVIWPDTL